MSTFYKALRPMAPQLVNDLTYSQVASLLDLDEVPTEVQSLVQAVPFEERILTPSKPVSDG